MGLTAAAKATLETSRAACGTTSEAVADEGQRCASMALEMIDCRSQHGRNVTKSGLSFVAYAGKILGLRMDKIRPTLLGPGAVRYF
jgi:hypothetical protein